MGVETVSFTSVFKEAEYILTEPKVPIEGHTHDKQPLLIPVCPSLHKARGMMGTLPGYYSLKYVDYMGDISETSNRDTRKLSPTQST